MCIVQDPAPYSSASAASHELPVLYSAGADTAECNATAITPFQIPGTLMPPIVPPKPPRVSFNDTAAAEGGAPVQSQFYSSSSEQYFSEVKR